MYGLFVFFTLWKEPWKSESPHCIYPDGNSCLGGNYYPLHLKINYKGVNWQFTHWGNICTHIMTDGWWMVSQASDRLCSFLCCPRRSVHQVSANDAQFVKSSGHCFVVSGVFQAPAIFPNLVEWNWDTNNRSSTAKKQFLKKKQKKTQLQMTSDWVIFVYPWMEKKTVPKQYFTFLLNIQSLKFTNNDNENDPV